MASTKAWKAHNECHHTNVPHSWNEFEDVGWAWEIPPNVTITRDPSQVWVSPPSAPHHSPRIAQPTGATAPAAIAGTPPTGEAEDSIILSFQDKGEGLVRVRVSEKDATP